MKPAVILLLLDYDRWASRRVLAAAAQLAPEQFAAESPSSHGSLRRTLVHTMSGMYAWRVMCERGVEMPQLDEREFPTVAAVAARWEAEAVALRAFVTGLQEPDFERVVAYESNQGEPRRRRLWECLVHVVNHGTHHRGQAVTLLRGHGHSPGDLDLTFYLAEVDKGRA